LAMDGDREFRAAARRPPRIQVKSQNPISNPDPSNPRTSRAPSPAMMGNYSTSRAPSPMGNYAASRAPSPAAMGNHSMPPPSSSAIGNYASPAQMGNHTTSRAPSPMGNHATARAPSPMRSPKTPSFVPPDVITPVFPASPEDMVGALTSMDTGLTYPYNIWGPVTKYGYLDDVAPTWAHKHHFGGIHVSNKPANRNQCHHSVGLLKFLLTKN
jgi:hypothetical protein